MIVEYCWDATGNVLQAQIISGPVPGPRANKVVGTIVGDPTLKKANVGGKISYLTSFSILYEVQIEFSINVLGKEISYKRGEKCQVTVSHIYAGTASPVAIFVDRTINPCNPWTAVEAAERKSMLRIDKPSYRVGESALFSVTDAPPNQPIALATTSFNGTPSGALDNCLNGHSTDGNGTWSGFCPAWLAGQVGHWQVTVVIGNKSDVLGFDVAGSPTPSRVTLTAVHSGKCLDVQGYSYADGADVYQWTCTGNQNQQWRLEPVGANTYRVIAVHSGKCLDVYAYSNADGADVYQWTCTGNQNQQWRFSAPPTNGQIVTLTAVHSGKCLDVHAYSYADGANVYQWTCTGNQNQQWRVSVVG